MLCPFLESQAHKPHYDLNDLAVGFVLGTAYLAFNLSTSIVMASFMVDDEIQ